MGYNSGTTTVKWHMDQINQVNNSSRADHNNRKINNVRDATVDFVENWKSAKIPKRRRRDFKNTVAVCNNLGGNSRHQHQYSGLTQSQLFYKMIAKHPSCGLSVSLFTNITHSAWRRTVNFWTRNSGFWGFRLTNSNYWLTFRIQFFSFFLKLLGLFRKQMNSNFQLK